MWEPRSRSRRQSVLPPPDARSKGHCSRSQLSLIAPGIHCLVDALCPLSKLVSGSANCSPLDSELLLFERARESRRARKPLRRTNARPPRHR